MPAKSAKPKLVGSLTSDIEALCESARQPRYRAAQIAKWLYRRSAKSFGEMTDLPKALREFLDREFVVGRGRVVSRQEGLDGTAKALLELCDGQTIESVFLPYLGRSSACLSTQVGCPVGCAFCASGASGFVRNLDAGEIVEQVLALQDETGERAGHVVLMGIGEPLLNYDETLRAIRLLNDEIGIGERKITLSTVGIPEKMDRLAQERLQITLALSLHAPDDATRRRLVPLAHEHPVGKLLEALKAYIDRTGRKGTIEYVMLHGVNDSPGQAKELARVLRGMMVGVNLIPYNKADTKTRFEAPSRAVMMRFRKVLEAAGLPVTLRMRKGDDIEAACGQLRLRSLPGKVKAR
jgi:23S rRNA (adenine2503-C2)-methyltransferase